MRYIFFFFGLCTVLVMLIAGKRGTISRRPPIEIFPDMNRQPKLRPQTPNAFFADGKSSRPPIPGTIAIDDSDYADIPVNTGRVPGTTNFIDTIPTNISVTAQLLDRGEQRFNINCSPCHGAQGDGKGITVKIGAMPPTPANLHDKRIVEMKDGELFNTITYGKNLMGPYGPNVTVEDRWAIIAYLRALQLSQLGTVDDVPEQMRSTFKK
ncbi:MAG TPA: cytochrome c [Verrucomicrobiae bacterium]|nr:cytochrome c [Verrucomicrobiae bacterium]